MISEPSVVYFSVKRAIDITVSVIFCILVLSWLYPLLALLIKLSSKGPVLFIQQRTGHNGKQFSCYKFRTMVVNDTADTHQAVTGDKRITKIGRVLRLLHLDELPQLFNVLKGDMTLVGPRPHMLYHSRYYAQYIPYYNLRHNAKPGLTGMAQIKGFIGEINIERDLRKRIQWDIYYLKHRSIGLDIKIIVTTLSQVMVKMILRK